MIRWVSDHLHLGSHPNFAILLIMEAVIIAIFSFTSNFNPIMITSDQDEVKANKRFLAELYPLFQATQMFTFIGFIFLYVNVHKISISSVSTHFFVGTIAIQMYLLWAGFWHALLNNNWVTIGLDVTDMIASQNCFCCILVTSGCVLGKVDLMEYVILTFVQVLFYSLNEAININCLSAFDVGGSVLIFLFGWIFGIVTAAFIPDSAQTSFQHDKRLFSERSATFSLIGILTIWIFFPSFVAASAVGGQKYLAAINMLLALTGSSMGTFAVLPLIHNSQKFDIDLFIRGIIGGGIVMGSIADLCVYPFAAVLVGIFGGISSVYLHYNLADNLKAYDTFGIFSFIGMPGLFGALISLIFASEFPLEKLGATVEEQVFANGNTPGKQSALQFAFLAISVGIAVLGGCIAGICLRSLHSINHFQSRDVFQITNSDGKESSSVDLIRKMIS